MGGKESIGSLSWTMYERLCKANVVPCRSSHISDLSLIPRVWSVLIDDHFMYPAELAEIFRLPKHILISESWRKSDDKNEIPLNDSNVGQMFPVLGNLLLLGLKGVKCFVRYLIIRVKGVMRPVTWTSNHLPWSDNHQQSPYPNLTFTTIRVLGYPAMKSLGIPSEIKIVIYKDTVFSHFSRKQFSRRFTLVRHFYLLLIRDARSKFRVKYLLTWSFFLFSSLIFANSSAVRGLKSAGFSAYGDRQAGQRPLPSVRILFQQNLQIWKETKSWVLNVLKPKPKAWRVFRRQSC